MSDWGPTVPQCNRDEERNEFQCQEPTETETVFYLSTSFFPVLLPTSSCYSSASSLLSLPHRVLHSDVPALGKSPLKTLEVFHVL